MKPLDISRVADALAVLATRQRPDGASVLRGKGPDGHPGQYRFRC